MDTLDQDKAWLSMNMPSVSIRLRKNFDSTTNGTVLFTYCYSCLPPRQADLTESLSLKPDKLQDKRRQLETDAARVTRPGLRKRQIAGVGFFLGFFASLFFLCCPLAMVILLLLWNLHSNTNSKLAVQVTYRQAVLS